MVINFVANYQNGYVGEVSDETHLAGELEKAGHVVNRIPRDIWKAICDGETNKDWPSVKLADINIIAKWHHFNDEKYINRLRSLSGAPVFYWVWDYMWDGGFPDWHLKMARVADLYLSGEQGIAWKYKEEGVNFYYFQFDVCDGDIPVSFKSPNEKYDVVFTGSYIGQGDRIDWLKKINEGIKITVFSWNHEEWIKNGFEAYPAVYGKAYNKVISDSKVTLGFSVNTNCWGYWSNRVGKVIRAGGLLLYQYTPGMETLIGDAADYFSSPEEAIEKSKMWIADDNKRREHKLYVIGQHSGKFTSKNKIAKLLILIERYIKTKDVSLWGKLPN